MPCTRRLVPLLLAAAGWAAAHPLLPEEPPVLLKPLPAGEMLEEQSPLPEDSPAIGYAIVDLIHDATAEADRPGLAGLPEDEPPAAILGGLATEWRANGMQAVFAAYPLSPERAYLTDSAVREALVAGAASAARLARAARLDGIILDTRASSLFYNPSWTGYDAAVSADALWKQAEEAGYSLGKALADVQVLVKAEALHEAGTLWWPFAAGVLNGLSDWGASRPSLLVGSQTLSKRALVQKREATQRWLGNNGLAAGVGFVLPAPTDAEAWLLAATQPAGYALLPAAALPPDAPPIPLHAAKRLGDIVIDDVPAQAFALPGDELALVLWDGAPRELTFAEVRAPVQAWNLRTGEAVFLRPAEDSKRLKAGPFRNPTVLGPLPLRAEAVRAGLWLTEGPPAKPGRPARYDGGLVNRSIFHLLGRLEVLAPPGVAATGPSSAIDLPPGESAAFRGFVDARSLAGRPISLSLAFTGPGGLIAQKTFSLLPAPAPDWETQFGDVPSGRPVRMGDDEETGAWIVFAGAKASKTGAGGRVEWRLPLPERSAAGPELLRPWFGGPELILSGSVSGTLRAFDGAGVQRWQRRLQGDERLVALAACSLRGGVNDSAVAVQSNGTIAAFDATGVRLWERNLPARPRWAIPYDADNDGTSEIFWLCAHGEAGLLDAAGEIRWQRALRASGACRPCIIQGGEDAVAVVASAEPGELVAVGLADGLERVRRNVLSMDLSDALAHRRPRSQLPGGAPEGPPDAPFHSLLPLPADSNGPNTFAAVSVHAVTALDVGLDVQWRVEGDYARPRPGRDVAVAASMSGTQVVAAVADAAGGIDGLDRNGQVVYRIPASLPAACPWLAADGDGLLAGWADGRLARYALP